MAIKRTLVAFIISIKPSLLSRSGATYLKGDSVTFSFEGDFRHNSKRRSKAIAKARPVQDAFSVTLTEG